MSVGAGRPIARAATALVLATAGLFIFAHPAWAEERDLSKPEAKFMIVEVVAMDAQQITVLVPKSVLGLPQPAYDPRKVGDPTYWHTRLRVQIDKNTVVDPGVKPGMMVYVTTREEISKARPVRAASVALLGEAPVLPPPAPVEEDAASQEAKSKMPKTKSSDVRPEGAAK